MKKIGRPAWLKDRKGPSLSPGRGTLKNKLGSTIPSFITKI